MKRTLSILLCVIVALFLSEFSEAGAALLFQQSLDPGLPGAFSNTGGQVIADEFTLATDATIKNIKWYGFYGVDLASGVTTLDFDASFFLDMARLPGAEVFGQTVSAQVQDSGFLVTNLGPNNGRIIYEFQIDLATPVNVASGQTAWLSIAENAPSTPRAGGTQWLWARSSFGPGSDYAFSGSEPEWTIANSQGDFAFELNGTTSVPEPYTMLLVGAGLVGLAGFRWSFSKWNYTYLLEKWC